MQSQLTGCENLPCLGCLLSHATASLPLFRVVALAYPDPATYTMTKTDRLWAAVLAILWCVALGAEQTAVYPVERVVDGDTVILATIGTVRLIGVDTPETVDPRKPVQRFGLESAAFLRSLLDGRQLYFISTRQGPRDIYAVDIADDGQVRGEPRRISTGLGAQSIAFSAERLVYVSYSARANIWSLPIPTSGTVDTSGARALTSGNQVIESLRVSHDGQWLLYDSTLHLNAEIFRLPLAGGPAERLTTDPSDDFTPDLSPDEREVAYHSFRSGSRDIFISPIAGGPAQQITATAAQESYPRWSPDGRALAFINQSPTKEMAVGLYLTRREASGGWSAPVAIRLASGVQASWLTNEQLLAATATGAIELIAATGGPARVVYAPTRPGDPNAENVLVAADGRTAYFKSHDADGRASFWAMPIAGGQPRLLVRFEDLSRVSIRPDFAVGAGKFFFTLEDRQADIWIADISRRPNR